MNIHVKHPFNNIHRFVDDVINNIETSQIYYPHSYTNVSITLGKKIYRKPTHNIKSFNPFYEIIDDQIFNQKLQIFKKWCLNIEEAHIRKYTNHNYRYKDIIYNVKNIEKTKKKCAKECAKECERVCIRECTRTIKEYSQDFKFKETDDTIDTNKKASTKHTPEARVTATYKTEESLNILPHSKDFSYRNVEYITEFIISDVKIIFSNPSRRIKVIFSYNPKTIHRERDIIDCVLNVLLFNNPEAKSKTPMITTV